MRNYINDGYNETGYVAERKGVYDSVTFTYRRALHAERAKVSDAGRTGSRELSKAVYLCLERHLVDWNIEKEPGTKLAIKAVEIAKLAPSLIDRLFDIVAGYGPSDDIPGAVVAVEQDELDAIMDGANVGDAAAEKHEKN